VARATELVGERWTLLIVRNLLLGASTFTGIARGVPHMSRSMLVKRLRDLEHDGIVRSQPKPNGQGHTYALTPAGADLATVIDGLAAWGARWADIRPEHTDPGFALWVWCQVQLDRAALPAERVVVAFTFPDEAIGNRRFWLLVEAGDAELCVSDPGGEPAIRVSSGSRAFVDWHRGARSWPDVVRTGDLSITGRPDLVRSFPRWNRHAPDLIARPT
jgi:DNA-binding HxlR family transcriptional regulator